MNGNFRNSSRGGLNYRQFNSFGQEQFNYNYQIPRDWGFHYATPNTYQTPANYYDMWPPTHQMPAHYPDMRPLAHQMPMAHYADNTHLTHQRPLTDQMPKPIPSDKKYLPSLCEICHVKLPGHNIEVHNNGRKHQRNVKSMEGKISKGEVVEGKEHDDVQNCGVETNDQLRSITTPNDCADKRPILQKTRNDFADKKISPHKKPEDYSDNQCLPQQKPERHADKRTLPHQMPKPTFPSDKKCLPRQMPKPIPSDKKCLPPLCEICHCPISDNDIEQHNNGKRHQRNVKSMEGKISKGKLSGHIRNSQMNPGKEVPKSKKDGRPVENMSQFRCKEVQVEGCKRKLGDHTGAKDHGFKCETGEASGGKYMKTNNGIRRSVNSSKSEVNTLSNSVKSLVQRPELTPPSGLVASPKMASIPVDRSSFELKSQCVSASPSQESKGKEYHKFQNTTPRSTPVELNASEGSNRAESTSCDFAAIAPPQLPVNCPVFTPSSAVGSSSLETDSQIEVEKGKEHHEVQNCVVETNDQLRSITTELHANGGSDITTLLKEDTCSDSGAIVSQLRIASQVATPVAAIESSFEPKSQKAIQIEMSDRKVHNEIQNHTVDSNDQQGSVSMELDDPAGCLTNTQSEAVNSDSEAIVIEPLAYALPDAVWSGYEPLTDTDTEIEPQVSEAVVYYESHHPIEETDIELPPSVPIEIDSASEVSTETADGSPQAEVEIDVLADELGIIQLPQVSVCLTCGNQGFEEAIIYCYKCKDYVIHRYCLDGPVIFTDEVIWFCDDCEEEAIDTDYPNQVTSDSEKREVDCSDGCVTVVDPQPIADPIWRGSLQIFHKTDDKITRLMGHLSTLACPKVLEETKHLPNVLSANLLQRSAVWPESFTKFGTNNLSIGLYFFPQNERVERYDQLVDEMISNDLAIRATIEETELLILPSTMLPSQYKRFQSKYYLWGIFVRKQTPSII